jgi:fumarylacetoacetase
VFEQPDLNALMALGKDAWLECLAAIDGIEPPQLRASGATLSEVELEARLPFAASDFVDFYASRHHAARAGQLMRPGAQLPEAWPFLPLGYHSRASSIIASGEPVRRPWGQFVLQNGPSGDRPTYAPTRKLDFELELGFVVGTPSDGGPVSPERAMDHVFGIVLLNDWSARDIQALEGRPLGPFLGKAFATSISNWVVPLEALKTRRVPIEPQTPPPLPHLLGAEPAMSFDLELTAQIVTARSPEPQILCRTNARHLYWSMEQHVAHLTSGGARLRTGDLLGTGTISGPEPDARACMLELSENGERPVLLAGGDERGYLHDGDEVIISGEGLGTLRNRILAASPEVATP